MTLAVAQGPVNNGNAGATGSCAATFVSGTASGSLLVSATVYNAAGGAQFHQVQDDVGNTYVAGPAEYNSPSGTGVNAYFNIYYAKNATAGAKVVTASLNSTASYFSNSIFAITGADTSAPYDTSSNGSAGSGTTLSTGTLSLATANEIIIALSIGVGAPCSPGTGYTGVNFNDTGDANAYLVAESHIVTANEAATVTQTSSATWGIIAAAFKGAAGGAAANDDERHYPRGVHRGFARAA